MTFSGGILVAIFGMSVVFAVLIALSIFIRLESTIINMIAGKHGEDRGAVEQAEQAADGLSREKLMQSMSGQLRLTNVNEAEAAAITAAITETGRLSGENLQVKSIKPMGLGLMDSMNGELTLKNVDEETASAIIAAVSDAGRASGENLVVKSIKSMDK